MRRTAEDAERTRLALLEAALMAFEEKGWRGATFDDVAARAGVTRGALNHHFSSKAALLEAALGWGWSTFDARLFDPTNDLTVALLVSDFVELLRDDPLFRALAASTVLVAPQASGDLVEKHDALRGWRDRIAATVPRTSHIAPETAANLVLALLQGFTVTAVTRPDDLPQPDDISAASEALERGLLT